MFERISRSWSLVKTSAGVLAKDKALLVFPLLSLLSTCLLGLAFVLPALGFGALDAIGSKGVPIWSYGLAVFFFNTALVGAALIRLEGGEPSVGDGLRLARQKVMPLLGYAAIAATVGMLIRGLQERSGFIGRWLVGLLGVAWTAVTFLVVPILVSRTIGPIDAIKDSAMLLKKTWGENLIGRGGVGLAFGLLYTMASVLSVGMILAAALSKSAVLIVSVVIVVALSFLMMALVQTALSGIYSAALYRYASEDKTMPEFDQRLLAEAFTPNA